MPYLKTNYIRTDIISQCFRYQFEILSNQPVDNKYHHQIQSHFTAIDQYIVFSYPYVYSTNQLQTTNTFYYMLSNGQKVQIKISNSILTLNSKQIAIEIFTQLMKSTNFLYNHDQQLCLNPFEERTITNNLSIMPGFKIVTQINKQNSNNIGIYLIALQVKISQFQSLFSLDEKSIMLDYNSGSFYKKQSIVRYDKNKELVHFRTGQIINKKYLKSVQIIHINGYEYAIKMNNYFMRIKKSQKLSKLLQKWQIKFDSRFLQLPYNFFSISHILCRNNQQKSLGQVIGSISSYNYQHNIRKIFNSIIFDDQIKVHIYFLIPQISIDQEFNMKQTGMIAEGALEQQRFILPILTQMQSIKQRMGLQECKISFFRYNLYSHTHNGYKTSIKEIDEYIRQQQQKDNIQKIFILNDYQQILQQQRKTTYIINQKQEQKQKLYHKIIQHFIRQGHNFHLLKLKDNQFFNHNHYDIIAMKTFSSIYTKLRFNPWKIKDIPFGTKPLIVFSVHLKFNSNDTVTISIVATLNAFLSKYTVVYGNCLLGEYTAVYNNMIKDCIDKFKSIHRVTPVRAIIFRTGDRLQFVQTEQRELQMLLITGYNCRPSVVLLNSGVSSLRVFNQIDMNYISKQTVKPTQLLCQFKYNNQRFIQLELQNPLYKVIVIGGDQQDPYFQQKCIQLGCKLIFTYSLFEMVFGRGLGFVDFGDKLYKFTKAYDCNEVKFKQKLKEGFLLFL